MPGLFAEEMAEGGSALSDGASAHLFFYKGGGFIYLRGSFIFLWGRWNHLWVVCGWTPSFVYCPSRTRIHTTHIHVFCLHCLHLFADFSEFLHFVWWRLRRIAFTHNHLIYSYLSITVKAWRQKNLHYCSRVCAREEVKRAGLKQYPIFALT